MYNIESEYNKVSITGELETHEALEIIEFYKKLGYNRVTHHCDGILLSKENEDDLHTKEIEALKYAFSCSSEFFRVTSEKLERDYNALKKKMHKNMYEWDEFIALNKHYEVIQDNLKRVTEEKNNVFRENLTLNSEIKYLKEALTKTKKMYFEKFNEEITK